MTAHDSAVVTIGDLGDAVGSFVRALERESLSANTIAAYATALRQMAEFLAAHGYPTDVRRIESRHLDEWISDLVERQRQATAHSRFRAARRFFDWYAETDESFTSPMRQLRPPRLPEYPRVMERDRLGDLARVCQGRAFEDRRDLALVRVFFDTGARRSEVANLRYSPTNRAGRDLDLDRATVRIFDKGRRERIVRLEHDTVAALDDYLRDRGSHPHANLPWLWLGKNGRLTDPGVGRALRARGMRAGIPDLHRLGHGLWIVKPAVQQAV